MLGLAAVLILHCQGDRHQPEADRIKPNVSVEVKAMLHALSVGCGKLRKTEASSIPTFSLGVTAETIRSGHTTQCMSYVYDPSGTQNFYTSMSPCDALCTTGSYRDWDPLPHWSYLSLKKTQLPKL